MSNGEVSKADENESDEPDDAVANEIASDLEDLIRRTVTPDDWDDTNGDGTIAFVGGLMVISGSEEQIRNVAQLVKQLEAQFPMEYQAVEQAKRLGLFFVE